MAEEWEPGKFYTNKGEIQLLGNKKEFPLFFCPKIDIMNGPAEALLQPQVLSMSQEIIIKEISKHLAALEKVNYSPSGLMKKIIVWWRVLADGLMIC